MNYDALIRTEAISLPVGMTEHTICPFCKARHEKKFYITRTDMGLLYQCKRVSCGAHGFVPSRSGGAPKKVEKEFNPKPYTGELNMLPMGLIKKLKDEYEFPSAFVVRQGWKYAPDGNRIHMPVMDHRGYEWGSATKRIPRDWGILYGNTDSRPKVVLYQETDVPRLHFPRGFWEGDGKIVLVEDILSASKLVYCGHRAIAILGTTLGLQEVNHLADLFGRESVYIALDADATDKALKIRNKYSLYFHTLEVITNKKDPKDMSIGEIKEKYGEANTECPISVS